jgi:DNA-binding beta-propeller fold protein YncE
MPSGSIVLRASGLAFTAATLALPALLGAQTPAPPQGTLLIGNKQAASLSVIDLGSGRTLATVPTGVGPHEVAVTRDGRTAIVCDYGDRATVGRSLTVVDLATQRVVRTIDLGEYRRPHGIAVLPGDSLVAVTAEANQALLVVHLASGTIRRAIPTEARGSHMVAVRADGARAYTANIPDGTVSELDLVSGRLLRTLAAATMTEGIGVTPDGAQVWVGSNDRNTVTVLDTRTGLAVDTLDAPGFPYRVGISADGRTAIVPAPQGGFLHVFDVATRSLRRSIVIGDEPVGAVITPNGRHAVVALQATNEAALVDLETGLTIRRYATGAGPDGTALHLR